MKKLNVLVFVLLFFACHSVQKEKDLKSANSEKFEPKTVIDTMPKVTGIGGIFFRSANPQKTNAWYGQNLGLAIDDYGSVFEFRNANRPNEINYLRWSPVLEGSDFFKPAENEWMINYRVQNIEGLVRNLKKTGVKVLDEIETFEYGKFVHILDLDGNKIELWEPNESFLTKMGGETTK